MHKNIVIAGSGFAGTWAALSAARAVALAGKSREVGITVVSPKPEMHIRPRLYEATIENMSPDISALLGEVGARHLPGRIETINSRDNAVEVCARDGSRTTLAYDCFVLATGSVLFKPTVPGLSEYAFDVDQLVSAAALENHLRSLASQPDTSGRNTVVVVGGGFTGIETAAEMPERLRRNLGSTAKVRVVIIEKAPTIGPELGAGPRPVIVEALAECGVEIITSTTVAAIDAGGLTLSSGERIASQTVVWTAGARANPLAAQIAGDHDEWGRVCVDAYLRAPAAPGIFVTGDVARAATDAEGNVAVMSCQHALSLGRVAGHNAAAQLLGLPLHPYSQPKYVTCLDLGAWGAILTEGWDRKVVLTRETGKATKREINTKWIYPPAPDREAVFAIANPDYVIVP